MVKLHVKTLKHGMRHMGEDLISTKASQKLTPLAKEGLMKLMKSKGMLKIGNKHFGKHRHARHMLKKEHKFTKNTNSTKFHDRLSDFNQNKPIPEPMEEDDELKGLKPVIDKDTQESIDRGDTEVIGSGKRKAIYDTPDGTVVFMGDTKRKLLDEIGDYLGIVFSYVDNLTPELYNKLKPGVSENDLRKALNEVWGGSETLKIGR